MEKGTWRLICSEASTGEWNMALDEALLESVSMKEAPPTLRLYSWEPPCLSLGYAQSFKDIDRQALQDHGWDLVRRPTGGRAILHTDEITYSVTAHGEEPRVCGGVIESYHRLSRALLLALQHLNLPAEAEEDYRSRLGANSNGPVCFETPSRYEITVLEKKLIGSAQARRYGGVLQHGSLPLCGDLARITHVLVYENEQERNRAAAKLLERATTVEEVLGKRVSWDEASRAMILGFQEALNLEFIRSEPLKAEIDRAKILMSEKYAHPSWTEKG